MKAGVLAPWLLRLRIRAGAASPVALAALLVGAAGAGTLAWTQQARALLEQERMLARQAAALPVRPAQLVAVEEDNLALFRRALGERRHAEQQVRALFALADKSALVLRQGEYREIYNPNARLYAYQVTLPVSGSYRAVWDFALQVLRAMPSAALDDIGVNRDTVGEATVQARLRFTFYLADAPARGGA